MDKTIKIILEIQNAKVFVLIEVLKYFYIAHSYYHNIQKKQNQMQEKYAYMF